MGIHELEDKLFQEWEEHLKQRIDSETVDNMMCYDGLHYTGIEDNSQGYWKMKPDNKEEELWKTAKIRPLFLTKDHNLQGDDGGVDVREETGLRNDTDNVYYPFYAKYLMLLYGITKINPENGFYPTLEEAKNSGNYLANFYKVPVVRMNLKKIAGESSCSNDILQDYIENDIDLIRRQIALYQPNVIVCCHGAGYAPRWHKPDNGENPIMTMLKDLYPDMQSVKFKEFESYNLYYSETSNVVIIHEWHPSKPDISYEDYYSVIPELAKFLQENPNVIR